MTTIARSDAQCGANDIARRRLLSRRGEPLFRANWISVLFVHFEICPERLQPFVPYDSDLFESKAYVSLVFFTMRDMRPAHGGRLMRLLFRPFREQQFFNVRTYVRNRGEPGIYFMAEWISDRICTFAGPKFYGLPYRLGHFMESRHAKSGAHWNHERRSRRGNEAGFVVTDSFRLVTSAATSRLMESCDANTTAAAEGCVIDAESGTRLAYNGNSENAPDHVDVCSPGTLDEFLLERYTAFTYCGTRRRFFRIWHAPWMQRAAPARIVESTLLEAHFPWFCETRLVGANYSPGVWDVWMGWPHRIGADS